MKILITGPQGSGKTTQAMLLSKDLKIPLIDTGRVLRDLAKQNTPRALKVREKIEKGHMAPNDIVADILKKRIKESDCIDGFVLDGYPRSLEQLKIFDPKLDLVFYLNIIDDLVKERLLERGRYDDTAELIEKRLEFYHKLTEPLLFYFKNNGILHILDGCLAIEQIHQQIKQEVGRVGFGND